MNPFFFPFFCSHLHPFKHAFWKKYNNGTVAVNRNFGLFRQMPHLTSVTGWGNLAFKAYSTLNSFLRTFMICGMVPFPSFSLTAKSKPVFLCFSCSLLLLAVWISLSTVCLGNQLQYSGFSWFCFCWLGLIIFSVEGIIHKRSSVTSAAIFIKIDHYCVNVQRVNL